MHYVGRKGNIWIEFPPSALWPRSRLEAVCRMHKEESFGKVHRGGLSVIWGPLLSDGVEGQGSRISHDQVHAEPATGRLTFYKETSDMET